eukprot:TRINITY_DN5674_c0_g1_i11.p1 TRINITY_DN5674_c0_g1~~TRINITY_DN5674_c0_g1_i11.p1  ORF type:complete len:154 (+),score=46.76 TRINITY_DN5674_c0_g1_i11:7-468(+)
MAVSQYRSEDSRILLLFFFFQAEDGIRDHAQSRGLGDVYKRQFLLSVLCFVLFLSLFMFSSIVEKKNLLQYMKKLNHSSFMARGLQISMVSDGVIRISLSLQVFLQLQREKVQKQTKKPIRVHHDKEKSESSSLASNPVESVQTKLTSTEIQG